jgi:hypothetical protein
VLAGTFLFVVLAWPGPRAAVSGCRVIASLLACRGLPSSCRRPGHFLLLAQEKVTKEKGPPDDAPSGPLALQVRGRVAGFFDRASCPGEKLAGIHAGHPSGFPPPARRVIRGPRRSEAASKASRATQRPTLLGRSLVGAHPVRDQPTERYTPALRSRTRCAPTRVSHAVTPIQSVDRSLWERTLCATYLRSGTPQRGCRAQGALPQTSATRGTQFAMCGAKADAQRGPALSPQRFGRVAHRFEVPAVYPRRLSRNDAPQAFGLIPTPCCGRYQAILFGLLSTRS